MNAIIIVVYVPGLWNLSIGSGAAIWRPENLENPGDLLRMLLRALTYAPAYVYYDVKILFSDESIKAMIVVLKKQTNLSSRCTAMSSAPFRRLCSKYDIKNLSSISSFSCILRLIQCLYCIQFCHGFACIRISATRFHANYANSDEQTNYLMSSPPLVISQMNNRPDNEYDDLASQRAAEKSVGKGAGELAAGAMLGAMLGGPL